MSKVQVIIATMGAKDFSLVEKMNIQSDAVIVNQCDTNGYEEFFHNGNRIIYVSTTQRGLSKSRNMALSYATGDIILIADDDIVYENGYPEQVLKAYQETPKADIIAFSTISTGAPNLNTDEIVKGKKILKSKPAPRNRYYGSVKISFKRDAVLKKGVFFNTYFGAGAKYNCGEDAIFLREARKKGLVVYQNIHVISKVNYTISTWFKGYDKEFYFNKGAWIAATYPFFYRFLKYYFFIRFRNKGNLSLKEKINCINKGIKDYKK